MSKTFEGVVCELRDLGAVKINQINTLFNGHQKWIEETVNDLKRRIDALGPPDKRQRISNDFSKGQINTKDQQVLFHYFNSDAIVLLFVASVTFDRQLEMNDVVSAHALLAGRKTYFGTTKKP